MLMLGPKPFLIKHSSSYREGRTRAAVLIEKYQAKCGTHMGLRVCQGGNTERTVICFFFTLFCCIASTIYTFI